MSVDRVPDDSVIGGLLIDIAFRNKIHRRRRKHVLKRKKKHVPQLMLYVIIIILFRYTLRSGRTEREIILYLYVTRPLVVSGQSRNSGGPKHAEVGEGARDQELK